MSNAVVSRRPRTVLYLRISEDRTGEELGVRRHERECRTLADGLGWDVTEVVIDNDTSAFKGKIRPGYARMLQLIEAGEVDAVLAHHPDRMHRSLKELETFIDLVMDTPLEIATFQAGRIDLTTASGRMNARNICTAARFESEHKSERQRSKARELAELGMPSGGSRPFGWTSSRRQEINEPEAAVIRGAVEMLLRGASKTEVVWWMNERSTTAAGTTWTLTKMHRVLWAAGLAGIRETVVKDTHGREVERIVTNENALWPAIITKDEHERLRRVLAPRRHRSPSRYLLTGGLAVCGLCGARLVAQPRRGGVRSYRCPQVRNGVGITGSCGRMRMAAKGFEEHVVDFALWWATEPDVIAARSQEQAQAEGAEKELRTALRSLEAREANLVDLAEEGDIARAVFRQRVEPVRKEIQQVRRQLDRVTTAATALVDGGKPAELRRRWDGLTLNEQRTVLGDLLAEVKVMPGLQGRNFFDEGRVLLRPHSIGVLRVPVAMTRAQWHEWDDSHFVKDDDW